MTILLILPNVATNVLVVAQIFVSTAGLVAWEITAVKIVSRKRMDIVRRLLWTTNLVVAHIIVKNEILEWAGIK